MSMGVEKLRDGCDEQALGLAAQYESTFGKPATVKDYTELVENHKPLPGSACPHFSNTGHLLRTRIGFIKSILVFNK